MIFDHLFNKHRVFASRVHSILHQGELCDVECFAICSELQITLVIVVFINIVDLVIVLEALYFILLEIAYDGQHLVVVTVTELHCFN